MKLSRLFIAIAAIGTIFTQACTEGSQIGESIVADNVLIVVDSAYTVTGKTVENSVVPSRTITQLLGVIDAPGYGTLSSEFVTQFMPALTLDTTNVSVNDIDSLTVNMLLSYGSYVGDSIAPLGLAVYPLVRELPNPIYSNFNPEGYYDKKAIGSTIYNLSEYGEKLTDKTYHEIQVTLPVELGKKLYTDYKQNPASFASPTAFAKIFPGLYVRNTYGSGRVSRVSSTTLQLHYHKTYYDTSLAKDTTTYHTGVYFAVTPEIISNNDIKLVVSDDIRKSVADGERIVLAPAGLDVEIQLPMVEIIQSYKKNITSLGVINSLDLTIPASKIDNKYNVNVPYYLLMVPTKEKDAFFAQNKITDDKTSFYAEYNYDNGTYSFSGLRTYLMDCIAKYDAGTLTADDYTFTLTPVHVSLESNSSSYYYSSPTVSAITPFITGLSMAKLNLENAKIKFIYTKQTVNF